MANQSAPTISPAGKGLAEPTSQVHKSTNKSTGKSTRQATNALTSRTLAALLAFVLLNVAWSCTKFGILKPFDFAFYTWTGCAIQNYLTRPRPNITFLGSSLVLEPLGSVDADLFNRDIDAARHNRSFYFENCFKERTGKRITTFNFSIPGEMPSDAYLVTKFLLQGHKKPDIIVYGVGPRDFMDNLLPSPQATDPFIYLSRFGDYSDQIAAIAPDWQQRLNYELGRTFFVYGHRVDLATDGERLFTKAMARLAPCPGQERDIAFRRTILPDYHPFECAVNECRFRPYVDRPRPAFVDNLVEYRKRYKQLKWDTFLCQMNFLSLNMEIARQRGIHFVLVSMPITDLNRQLLGDFPADVYKKSVSVLAKSKGATFIDLDGSKQFDLADFEDTVHLHSGGGRKMLSMLATELANDRPVQEALNWHPAASLPDKQTDLESVPAAASQNKTCKDFGKDLSAHALVSRRRSVL